METLNLFNGNNQEYTIDLPCIIILGGDKFNDVAQKHIQKQTGLKFEKCFGGIKAQPTESNQITCLFLTYNFKSRYYNNWNYKNTLVLKSDHHIGFDVDSVCFSCLKENNIHITGLKPNERLSC
jgi:hypothetical protein